MSKRFRTGDVNAAGGRPLNPRTKEYRCVTAGTFLCERNTAQSGGHIVFTPSSYNCPVRMNAVLNFTEPTGINAARHPSGHQAIIADGYDTFMVKSAYYAFKVQWTAANAPARNWVVAYKFDTNLSATAPTWPIGVQNTETWLDLQASPGWVYHKYGCDRSGKGLPTHGHFNVKIPDVPGLTIKLQKNTATTQFTTDDLIGTIADSTTTAAVNCFLHIIVFMLEVDGIVAQWTDLDIWLDVRCTQTIKVWQKIEADEFIDEGDDV